MGAVRAALFPVGVMLLFAHQARAADPHVIAVNVAPEQTCPAPRQVTDALAARLPGTVLPPGQPAKPGMLRLAIATDASGSIRLDLADPDGAPLLHRVLAPTRGPGECAALADTIALIIERYWRDVGYDAPPLAPPSPPAPPPPPPAPPPSPTAAAAVITRAAPESTEAPHPGFLRSLRWSVAAAIAGRAGDEGVRDMAVSIAVGAEGRIGIRLSAGVSSGTTTAVRLGQADFRRFPLRLGGYLPIRVGVGQLEPGLGLDLDLINFAVRGNSGVRGFQTPASCSDRLCGAPGADLALGWSYVSSHHIYVRALGRLGVAASYTFSESDPAPMTSAASWRTPSTYLEVGLESGLWFP
jgi:hypothetical protein